MPRTFLTLTQTEINTKLAESIKSREQELASYDFEAANHTAAIAALGDIAWDDSTSKYKGLTRDVMIARAMSDGLDAETIQKVAALLALDFHQLGLQAVAIETAKSERSYNALLTALPAGVDRDAAFATLAADASKASE